MTLFTVDQDRYLDAIVKDSPENLPSDGELYDQFSVARNTEARLLIQSLVRAWHSPEEAAVELDMIRQEMTVDDIDQSKLQYAVVDSMTDPRGVVRRASDDRILNWWGDFLSWLFNKERQFKPQLFPIKTFPSVMLTNSSEK